MGASPARRQQIQARRSEVVTLVKAGLSHREIAERLGVPVGRVNFDILTLQTANVLPTSVPPSARRRQILHRLRRGSQSVPLLAVRLQVARSTIEGDLRALVAAGKLTPEAAHAVRKRGKPRRKPSRPSKFDRLELADLRREAVALLTRKGWTAERIGSALDITPTRVKQIRQENRAVAAEARRVKAEAARVEGELDGWLEGEE
jgi:DNA-binding CsgD family transcriptional regulator